MTLPPAPTPARKRLRRLTSVVFVFLAIEFVDEFVFGAREVAWPLIRSELNLHYTEIGLLLGLPVLIAAVIESGLGILSDIGHRKMIIVVGGIVFTLAALLTAVSGNFAVLLISFSLFYPASGAFVALSQSSLMDIDTARHEHNMARWAFFGSFGVICGIAGIGLLTAFGLSWRILFAVSAGIAFILMLWLRHFKFPPPAADEDGAPMTFKEGLRNVLRAMRRGEIVRWLVVLEFANLLQDVVYGYLALYLVDVAGLQGGFVALAIGLWVGAGFLGDLLLIPLLEHVPGLRILRVTAVLELIVFAGFLALPGLLPKLILLTLSGLLTPGWYSILRGQLYSAMPGQSGTVLTLDNIVALPAGLIPLVIGFVAERFGLGIAIWILLLGPVALLVGLPTKHSGASPDIIADEALISDYAKS